MSVWLLILICCVSMFVKDAVGVFMTVAEAKGNERLAGILNPAGTLASIFFYSVGALGLVHGHGIWGILGLIPVLCVDYVDGRYFTAASRHIESDENSDDADLRGLWNACLVVSRQWTGGVKMWLHQQLSRL